MHLILYTNYKKSKERKLCLVETKGRIYVITLCCLVSSALLFFSLGFSLQFPPKNTKTQYLHFKNLKEEDHVDYLRQQ